MKKKKNRLLQFFYYALAFILAAFALGPLVWMVDTSFKTNSEVLSYPPKWGTINALPSRVLNATINKIRTSENVNPSTLSLESLFSSSSQSSAEKLASPDTLVINVLGASGYRGTDTMPRRGMLDISLIERNGEYARYAVKLNSKKFNKIILENSRLSLPYYVKKKMNSLKKYKDDPLEYILNFYDVFLYSTTPILDRLNFIGKLESLKMPTAFEQRVEKYKRGSATLSVSELKEIEKILEKARKSSNSMDDVSLLEYENVIKIFENVNTFFEESKDKKLSGDIRVEFIPNSHKMRIIHAPSIVESVYQDGNEIKIKFKGISFVWFINSRVKLTAHYNFWQVLANLFQNYVSAWKSAPFGRYYINSIFVASTTTLLNIIFDAMMAFAFSKLSFPGRDKIFLGVIATMMIPYQVLLVANYLTIHDLGWLNTYYALIIPWASSAFVVFLMRQAFNSIPQDFYDAAKIDGASSWRFLWSIAVPISRPVVITGALLTFVGSWNAFLWVLIMTDTPNMRTIPVGLQNFTVNSGTIFNQLMAAATFSMLPIVIAFMFLQKYFVGGLFRSGIK